MLTNADGALCLAHWLGSFPCLLSYESPLFTSPPHPLLTPDTSGGRLPPFPGLEWRPQCPAAWPNTGPLPSGAPGAAGTESGWPSPPPPQPGLSLAGQADPGAGK